MLQFPDLCEAQHGSSFDVKADVVRGRKPKSVNLLVNN
jgi:hypothetical protein